MARSNPYRHADKEMADLIKELNAEFNHLALRLPMDELNFPTAKKYVSSTYQKILKDVVRAYRRISKEAIKDARERCLALGLIADPDIQVNANDLVKSELEGYNRTSRYVFNNEWERKQDRTIEALIAIVLLQDRRKAIKTSNNLLWRQVQQYGDEITDTTMLSVYREFGVDKVMWVAELDEKTCNTCYELDGNIYNIDDAPSIPQHYHCRCYLVPVKPVKGSGK